MFLFFFLSLTETNVLGIGLFLSYSTITSSESNGWDYVRMKETLIIWGDQDKVFPLELAHHL